MVSIGLTLYETEEQFSRVAIQFHMPTRNGGGLCLPHIFTAFGFVGILYFNHCNRSVMISPVVLICICLTANDIEGLFSACLFLNAVFIQAFLLVPTYCSFWSWSQFILFSLQNVFHFLVLRMSRVILDCVLHIRNVKLRRVCFLLFFSGERYFLCGSGCFSLLDLNFLDLKCRPQCWSSVVSSMVWVRVNMCMSRQSLGIPSLAFLFLGFPVLFSAHSFWTSLFGF